MDHSSAMPWLVICSGGIQRSSYWNGESNSVPRAWSSRASTAFLTTSPMSALGMIRTSASPGPAPGLGSPLSSQISNSCSVSGLLEACPVRNLMGLWPHTQLSSMPTWGPTSLLSSPHSGVLPANCRFLNNVELWSLLFSIQ